MNGPNSIEDRSIQAASDAGMDDFHHIEVARTFPGLRINSRLTTSSLSDYPQFDLNQIREGKKSDAVVTDGESA